ncbi:MAG TPA: toll/interleukin-1 receptor domain-containing protein [Pyrinomonadaceae bacterium]|nr:toll/interleukin-1 receptor domain-containing protein [Pyrinomonadaceae bacterium]
MSPIPDYEDDLFISYAHIDNQPLVQGQKGWVETLHESLLLRLKQLTGEPVSIWRDRKLQGNDVFAETLLVRLSNVAVLVTVLSPCYVKSEWCLRELEEFTRRAAARGGLQLSAKSRVFSRVLKVVKTHVPLESHPPPLRGAIGYDFFEYDAELDRATEFGNGVTPQGDQRYWQKIDDIVYSIRDLFGAMRGGGGAVAQVGAAPPARPAAGGGGKVVYLAETISALEQERDLIKRELQQLGHVVLPDVKLPAHGGALREAAREFLGRSELSVHLVGGYYGVIPEEETRSLVEIQCELAGEAGGRLRQIVWMPVGLEPRDERQREFVERYRLGLNGRRQVEVLQTSLEDLKKLIEERVSAPPESRPGPPPAADDAPPRVYLLYDREDLGDIAPVEDYLYQSGFDVAPPGFDGDEKEIREYHQEQLRDCDGVLIYYGRGSDTWLRMKQQDLLRIRGLGRKRPLAACVYVAAPRTTLKEHVRDNPAAKVVKNFEGAPLDCLSAFVERVRQAKGGQG